MGERRHHQINTAYPGCTLLHGPTPVYTVSNFLDENECMELRACAKSLKLAALVSDSGVGGQETRTASSYYMNEEEVPTWYHSKLEALSNLPSVNFESPQIGRYLEGQYYRAHFDAVDNTTDVGREFCKTGGQRIVTVLVYLNSCDNGGHTLFNKLGLSVKPVRGLAVVFFPAFDDGSLDTECLHEAQEAGDEKWVSQVWMRQFPYRGA